MNPRVEAKGYGLDVVYGKHEGDTVVILGNSSSLNAMDLTPLRDYVTIGVNRILRIFDPTYLFIVDESVMRDEFKRIPPYLEAGGLLMLYPGLMNSKVRAKYYNGPWISTGPMSSQCDPCAKDGYIHICRGGNSAYEAAQVAYRMGASHIILAGVDMFWPCSEQSHFFGNGSALGCKLPRPDWKVEDFRHLKELYHSLGTGITSCSPWDTPFRRAMGYTPLS
uniref:Uncharacterized protein n=2 Tax=viral metagenome TaxID=1070528 RepID=A0A6H1ZH76_9ZZZZ